MDLRSYLPFGRKKAPAKQQEPEKRRLKTAGYEPYHTWVWQQHRDLPLFTFGVVHQMLLDGQVRLALAARAAPIQGVQIAYKNGETWTPGIKARRPEVGAFVLRQLERLWTDYIADITSAQIWGWSGGEITLRLTHYNLVEFEHYEPRHAADVRLLKRDGHPCGVRFDRVQGTGHCDLAFPRAFFHSHMPNPGDDYGQSCLIGAYSPWADKNLNGGALDVRRLFMHKDAYGGTTVGYPSDGDIWVAGRSEPIPARDVARQIAEQLVAGGVVTKPTDRDENGNEKWTVDRAQVPNNPQHILQYPQDLDSEIRTGIGVPDGILDDDGGGAWGGKRVIMAAFYATLDTWVRSIIRDFCEQVIDPLIVLNWGAAEEYEVTHKPLAEQAMEQQSNAGPGQPGKPGAQGQQPQQGLPGQGGPSLPQSAARMSLDPVAAVGQGVLDAAELVQAANHVIRMNSDKDALRWITIGSNKSAPKGEKGGTPVQISGSGEIKKGPKSLEGRNVGKLSKSNKPPKKPTRPEFTKEQSEKLAEYWKEYESEKGSDQFSTDAWKRYSDKRAALVGDVEKAQKEFDNERRREKVSEIAKRSKELSQKKAWEVTAEEYVASRKVESAKQAAADLKKFGPMLKQYEEARAAEDWRALDDATKAIEETRGYKSMIARANASGDWYGSLSTLAAALEKQSKLPEDPFYTLYDYKVQEEHENAVKKQVEKDIGSVSIDSIRAYQWKDWMPPEGKNALDRQMYVDSWTETKDSEEYRKKAREGRKLSSTANAAVDTYRKAVANYEMATTKGLIQQLSTNDEEIKQLKEESSNALIDGDSERHEATWSKIQEKYTERFLIKDKIEKESAAAIAEAIGDGEKSSWNVSVTDGVPPEQKQRIDKAIEWLSAVIPQSIVPAELEIIAMKPGDPNYSDRSYQNGGKVYLAPHADTSVIIHEIGHAIEHANDNAIGRKSVAFLHAKTFGQKVNHLGSLYGNYEVATQDGFMDAYTGKYYNAVDSEILSMGLQHLYDNAKEFAEKSPDHFNYTVAAMRGLV